MRRFTAAAAAAGMLAALVAGPFGLARASTGAALAGTGAARAGTGAALAGSGPALAGTGAALAGTGAALAGTGAVRAGTGPVLLGASNGLGDQPAGTEGFGKPHPSLIWLGGDSTTQFAGLHWSHWGSPTSTTGGRSRCPNRGPGYHGCVAHLTATSLGECRGHRAYRTLVIQDPGYRPVREAICRPAVG